MSLYNASPINFESVSAVTATPSVEVGTDRREGNQTYRYVYNAGNSQAIPGVGCTISAVSGYSITISSVTSVDMLVGVIKHTTITTGTYGWMLVQGWSQFQAQADNSFTSGQLLTVGGDGKFALKSNSTGYPCAAIGKSMEAVASGASGQAFFNFL